MGFALKTTDLPHYTYDDYTHWEGRWELIKGIPYSMSPLPSLKHQDINGKIYYQLFDEVAKCKQCKVFMPIEWKIDKDTIVQPDISIICKKIDDSAYATQIDFPPTLIFEILSPSNKHKDLITKFELYQSEKVNYYILIHPDTEKAEVYEYQNNQYHKVKETHHESVTFELEKCKVKFDFNTIW